jgi:hypothetical protein
MGVILHDQIILIAYSAKVRAASVGMPLGSVVISCFDLEIANEVSEKSFGEFTPEHAPR